MSTKHRKRLSWVLLTLAGVMVIWQGTVTYQNQRRLEEAEQRLGLALWGSDNGLFDWAVPSGHTCWDTTVAWYSDHFTELLGIEPDGEIEHTGGFFLNRVRDEDRANVIAGLQIAVDRENGFDVVFQARHEDGTFHWYTLRGRYSVNSHSRVSGTLLDITPRMKERQRADLIVLSSPDAMITYNDRRLVTMFNPAAEKMFGTKASQMIGQPVDEIITTGYLADYKEGFAKAVEKLRAQDENWIIRKEAIEAEGKNITTNEVFPVQLSVRGIKYRGEMEFIATISRADEPAPAKSLPLPPPGKMMMEQRPRPMMRAGL